jgi:hypothetical protein
VIFFTLIIHTMMYSHHAVVATFSQVHMPGVK